MNDLERIIKEMREDRDIWKSIARKIQTTQVIKEQCCSFEVWDGDDVIANDLDSLLEIIEGHGYIVKKEGR